MRRRSPGTIACMVGHCQPWATSSASSGSGTRVWADIASAASGFGENADVDATVIAPGRSALQVLRNLAAVLPTAGFELREEIYGARVPILRLVMNGIDFDLSVNNMLPVYNTQLIKAYGELEPRVVDLVREVKRWAKAAGVLGAPDGHLSSYAWTLLVIYYAQYRGALPVLQGEHVQPHLIHGCNVAFGLHPNFRVDETTKLSFTDFVSFYSKEYDWGRECVSVRTGGHQRDIDEIQIHNQNLTSPKTTS